MSIQKYTTEAFILAEYEQGEHDKAFKLFTRDFGVLFAVAKGIRKLESKMRFHFQKAKKISVTLVKGKEVWRITGVEGGYVLNDASALACQIVERFVHGEVEQKNLFRHVDAFLTLPSDRLPKEISLLTLYYVTLVDLGYADGLISGAKDMEEFFLFSMSDHFTHVFLRKELIKEHVHTVLSEMQL